MCLYRSSKIHRTMKWELQLCSTPAKQQIFRNFNQPFQTTHETTYSRLLLTFSGTMFPGLSVVSRPVRQGNSHCDMQYGLQTFQIKHYRALPSIGVSDPWTLVHSTPFGGVHSTYSKPRTTGATATRVPCDSVAWPLEIASCVFWALRGEHPRDKTRLTRATNDIFGAASSNQSTARRAPARQGHIPSFAGALTPSDSILNISDITYKSLYM